MEVLERKAKFVALEQFYYDLSEKEPCTYTVDEIKHVAMLAEQDILAGKGILQEEMRKKYALKIHNVYLIA